MKEPSCRLGYTEEDLEVILGDRLTEFWGWMRGQTGAVCDGTKYDPDTKTRLIGCEEAHMFVVYAWDLRRFIEGSR